MTNLPAILQPETGELKLPAQSLRVLGIDLGTTNSTAAEIVWNPDHSAPTPARCLEVEQPTLEGTAIHVLVPSVVAIHGGQVIVGEGGGAAGPWPPPSRPLSLLYKSPVKVLPHRVVAGPADGLDHLGGAAAILNLKLLQGGVVHVGVTAGPGGRPGAHHGYPQGNQAVPQTRAFPGGEVEAHFRQK